MILLVNPVSVTFQYVRLVPLTQSLEARGRKIVILLTPSDNEIHPLLLLQLLVEKCEVVNKIYMLLRCLAKLAKLLLRKFDECVYFLLILVPPLGRHWKVKICYFFVGNTRIVVDVILTPHLEMLEQLLHLFIVLVSRPTSDQEARSLIWNRLALP